MFATELGDAVLGNAERTTLESVFETFAPPEADRAGALETIERHLRLLPAERRAQFVSLLQLLGGPLFSAALTGKPAPFSRLPLADRERLLLKMANSDLSKLRAGFQVLKRTCLFMAYAVVDERGSNPLWTSIGYPGPRQDRPAQLQTLRVLDEPAGDFEA